MKQRSSLRNQAEAALVSSLFGGLRTLPRAQAEKVALGALRAWEGIVPKFSLAAERNFDIAFPGLDHTGRSRLLSGTWSSLAKLLVSVARFPAINRSNVAEWIRYEGFEHFETAKRRGKGVLFATAHLGNWELSAFAHALLAEPMTVVVRPLDNPILDQLTEQLRSLSGNRIIGKRDFTRPILQALKDNEAVGILVDQNSSLERGVFVDFFGKSACVDAGFCRLAAHTGAAVIPGFAVWSEQEAKYILRFYPEIPMQGDLQKDTQAVHTAVENAVRAYPDQWLWIHRRWKTRPPGEPELY